MALLATVLVWLGVLVAAAVLSLVALPVHLHLKASSQTTPAFQARLTPWNGWGPSIPLARSASDKHENKPDAKRKTPKSRSAKHATRWLKGLPDLFGELLRVIELRWVSVDATFGLDDPADTGAVFGVLAPVVYGNPCQRVHTRLVPSFDGPCFTGAAEAKFAFTPLRGVPPLVRYVATVTRLRGR